MKQFLQDKYPHLLCEDKLLLDSAAMEIILKAPRSLERYLANKREQHFHKWQNFASALQAAFAVRHNDSWVGHYHSEQSLERQVAAITDYLSNEVRGTKDLYIIDCAINTILQYDSHYKLKTFQIHALDERPCLEISFAIPIGHVEDIPIVWTGRIPSVIHLNDHLYIMVHKIKCPADGDDFEIYRNTSEMIGYHWAYEQLSPESVKGVLVDSIRVHDMGSEPEHVDFNREFEYYYNGQISEWQTNLVKVVTNFLNSVYSTTG